MAGEDQDVGTIVVLTPMQLEYRAMRPHLDDRRREWHSKGTFADIGRIEGVPWPVALVVTGEGNLQTAVVAERLAEWLRPIAMLVVGIAGSLKPDIDFGDVVVSTRVHGYHGGKEDDAGFHARPQALPIPYRLLEVARAVDLDATWTTLLPEGAEPAVHFKPIAAGEVVLNSAGTALRRQLGAHYNDAAAIEMESAGAATAALLNDSLPTLTIRGISDKADGDKHLSDEKGWQPLAASHAAAFAVALLQQLPAAVAAAETTETSPRRTRGDVSVQTISATGGTVYAVQNGQIFTGPPPHPPR